MQATQQSLTNMSMRYLNYPAKVLFKSSRIVPVMMVGCFIQRRRYHIRDYASVLLIVAGLILFMEGDMKSSPTFSYYGVSLISVALLVDAAILNVQEFVLNKYKAHQDELILYSYLSGTVVQFIICYMWGELGEGINFVRHTSSNTFTVVALYSVCGFLGVSCVAAVTKRFGELISSITTTARKATNLFLSFFLYPKDLSTLHISGIIVFCIGLLLKSIIKWIITVHEGGRALAKSASSTALNHRKFGYGKRVEV